MHLDVSSVGNHEFDEGVDELMRMQKGGCLPDGPNGANGQNSCPGSQDFKGADFKYLGANVAWKNPSGHPRPTPFRPYQIFKVRGPEGRLHRHDARGHARRSSARPASSDVEFKDEVETANALVPGCGRRASSRSSCCCTRGSRRPTRRPTTAAAGVSGAGLAIAQNLSPQIDAVVSGHTHQPYNCVVKDPRGRPRLFTSASSFGRMITKLHFLIDPKTHDIVRPAAFAENIVNANAEGQKQSKKVSTALSTRSTPSSSRSRTP